MTHPAAAPRGTTPGQAGPAGVEHRWLILGVIALAQLMIVLDATVMNIALPTAQKDLGFSVVDRQWVVRSPVRWSSWSLTHLPKTSLLSQQRHATSPSMAA